MKKLLAGIVTAALALSLMTVSASAHHHRAALDTVCGGLQTGHLKPTCIGRWGGGHYCWDDHYCVDTDKDGICDNYGHEHCPGNGACGNYAQNGGYVDADNDGVCDNYDPEYCPGNGGGYVDTDNNGVCDNYDPEYCPGNGAGTGNSTGTGSGAGNGAGSGSGYRGGHHSGCGHGRHHG